MKARSLTACVSHWLKRVEKGQTAFRFKAVEDSHRRDRMPKRKRHQPVSDDDEEEEESKGAADSAVDVLSKNGMDGDEADEAEPVEQQTLGKGKAKALPRLWYE